MCVAICVVDLLAGCSDDEAKVTRADLLQWLETENTNVSQADPACTADQMLAINPAQDELRELIAVTADTPMEDYVEPALMDVYLQARDSCSENSFPGASDVSHLPKCDDHLGEGVLLTVEAFDLPGCVTIEGEPAFYAAPATQDCADGRTLYSLEGLGWGYLGEPWHKDGSSTPPADELVACGATPSSG